MIPSLQFGGAERMLEKLVTGSDAGRFHHQVLSMTGIGPIGNALRAAGVPVLQLGMGLGRPSPAGLARALAVVRRFQPHLIQCWMYHANLLGLVTARLTGTRHIVWGIRCSDMDLRLYSRLTGLTVRLNAWLSAVPDALVANSHAGAEFHRRIGFSSRRMHMIPNGFDTGRFRPDPAAAQRLRRHLNLPETTQIIGLVARVDPMKDHDTFFAAAFRVLEKHRDICFVLIGEGTEKVARGREPGDKIHTLYRHFRFLGPRTDVHRLLPGMDLAVSSSAFGEGFSNTLGEAMACGVPCVTTDVGDSAHIVGNTGFVVVPGHPEKMARAMERFINLDSDKRTTLSRLARQRIKKTYALDVIVSEFERLYGKICAE